MGYQPKVYREQGGDKFVVASGGEAEVKSGGTLTMAGTQTVTGLLGFSGSGVMALPVETASTAANLSVQGLSLLGSTAAGKTYTLPKPTRAGLVKALLCKRGSTANTVVLTPSGAVFSSTSTGDLRKMSFSGNDLGVLLVSHSTTLWGVIATANSTKIVVSST